MRLSDSQLSIYEMAEYAAGAVANIAGDVFFEQDYSKEALHSAVNQLIAECDMLRMRIRRIDGKPDQTLISFSEVQITTKQFDDDFEYQIWAEQTAREPVSIDGQLCCFWIVCVCKKTGVYCKLHHIIGDAWSMGLLANRLIALLSGEETDAIESYDRVLASEEQYQNSKKHVKDSSFWLEKFDANPESFFIAKKRAQTTEAERREYCLSAELSEEIRMFCNKHAISEYCAFLSAISVYYHRITGANAFYIGTPVLNRATIEEKNTVGAMIHTIPLLVSPQENESFLELCTSLQTDISAAFRHQKFSYSQLLKMLRDQRGFKGVLYDVLFSFQNVGIQTGAKVRWYYCGAQTESLQIHVDDRNRDGRYHICYDYQTEKYASSQIECMHRHIIRLLQSCITTDVPTASVEMLSFEEKKQLTETFNDTFVELDTSKVVHQRIERQVELTPDRIAVVACDRTLTYAQLNEQANRIAHALIEKGICADDIVALRLSRTSILIAAILGVLKSGAAFLPISPDYPQARIRTVLTDSGAKAILTDDSITEFLFKADTRNPNVSVDVDASCYVIYTSGSTGVPKGTVLTHRNVLNYADGNQSNQVVHKMLKTGCVSVLSVTTVGFDIFMTESILPLMHGMRIVLANERQAMFQSELSSLLRINPADVLQTTPTKMRSLMADTKNLSYLKALKMIVLGGEVFPPELFEKLRAETTAEICNIYGPSEATVWVTNALLQSKEDITIGKPIANTQIYIVDPSMRPVPVCVEGELCVSGYGVGKGYLNRPELDEERFVRNPFGKGKLYKTGDIAYWREDGQIVYVGRKDNQVKIRGLRIELGEIENAIASVPGVVQTVATVFNDPEGRQIICAYYTGDLADENTIQQTIGEVLPRYMIPHSIMRLDAMPLTATGKVDRNALPLPALADSKHRQMIDPETMQETALFEAVCSVLKTDCVNMGDSFFNLGGDSLKAIELIGELETKGYGLEIKDLFEAETLLDAAAKCFEHKDAEHMVSYGRVLPATPAQMRIYTAQSMRADYPLYNIPFAIRTNGIDPNRLQNALEKMVERHESLRTHFENRDGRIVQVIDATAPIILEQLPTADITNWIRPFNMAVSPLLRAGIYENTLVLDIHHSIADGSSIPVFLQELNDFYMGREPVRETTQYGTFATEPVDTKKSGAHWDSVLSESFLSGMLYTDYPRGDQRPCAGAGCHAHIDAALHKEILTKCRQLQITPNAFYLSCFSILVSRYSDNTDVVVGMPVNGRRAKYLNTIGMFVNSVILRTRPNGEKSIRTFLQEIGSQSTEAINHQNYPIGELIKTHKDTVSVSNSLFDVMFAYQSESMSDIFFGDQRAEMLPPLIIAAKCDLTLNVFPGKDGAKILAEYRTDLFVEERIQRMIDGYIWILRQMLQTDRCIKEIHTITDHEEKLLAGFNAPANAPSHNVDVVSQIGIQVGKSSETDAVIACDRTLTYAELNAQANRIAHALQKKGVRSGDIVAFRLPRKSYLFSVMLGILKAGAAYLPIDPDYPRERIEYMLADSRAKLCITDDMVGLLLQHDNDGDPDSAITGESICYCIYTSGSTGKPKGTLITHSNVVNYCSPSPNNVVSAIIPWENAVIASVTTVSFDIFVTESLLPLINGFTVVLANETQSVNQLALNELLCQYPADVLQTTPTKMKLLMKDSAHLRFLHHLRSVMLGGEAFDYSLFEKLKVYTEANVFNVYGPTETTVWSTIEQITGDDITIGKPIANTQAIILDKENRPAPIGVVGELYIAGSGVCAGYLNRQELTAERFVDNPYRSGKMYRTGDLAFWRNDGKIAFVGRNDNQVKIRGLRIELGEIEEAISAVDGVLQAAVTVFSDEENRQFICAYFAGQASEPAIRKHIDNTLPKYMSPHCLIHLETIPLTPNEKVDRNALLKPDLRLSSTTTYVPPHTEREKILAEKLAEILGVEKIGITENIFDLGCDSLKAIEWISACQTEGVFIDLQSVYDHPTISALLNSADQTAQVLSQYDQFDFDRIHRILEMNSLARVSNAASSNVGDILLAGATGYLGAHILAEYLRNDVGTAYCVVRGSCTADSEQRLEETLRFYFGEEFVGCKRIKVLCGDFTRERFGLDNTDYQAILQSTDTVINAMASVKHFGAYDYFYETNVKTVIRMIAFCKAAHAKLIHISTTSVAGVDFESQPMPDMLSDKIHFTERDFYVGQPLRNVYVRSKFEAERVVFDAMCDGLQANVMRMGNLMNRRSDGVFQRNYKSNAFVGRLKAMVDLGYVPHDFSNLNLEFTPIDDAAGAIMTVVRHFRPEQNVFHIENEHQISVQTLLEYLKTLNKQIQMIDEQAFYQQFTAAKEHAQTKHIYDAFINDLDSHQKLNYAGRITVDVGFTASYLQGLGFQWQKADLDYFQRFFKYFKGIGYIVW